MVFSNQTERDEERADERDLRSQLAAKDKTIHALKTEIDRLNGRMRAVGGVEGNYCRQRLPRRSVGDLH